MGRPRNGRGLQDCAQALSNAEVELVDSRRKRCMFLEKVAARAGDSAANLSVRNLRVEALDDGVYDGVVARAFAPPDEVLVHARRLLKPGGQALLYWLPHQRIGVLPAGMVVGPRRDYSVGGRALCVQCVIRSPEEK